MVSFTDQISKERASSVDMNGFVCQTAAQNIKKTGELVVSNARKAEEASQTNFDKVKTWVINIILYRYKFNFISSC